MAQQIIARTPDGSVYLLVDEALPTDEAPPADATGRVLDTTTDTLNAPQNFHSITAHMPYLEPYTPDEGELAELLDGVRVEGPPVTAASDDTRESAATSKYADYSQGDMVSYGDGENQNGLVLEVFTGDFTWPGTDDEEPVTATKDTPLYVVARATGGSGVYEESELEESDFLEDEDEPDPSELAEEAEMAAIYEYVDDVHDPDEMRAAERVLENIDVPGVTDEPGTGFDSLPNGWDRLTVLRAWASMGASFSGCSREMTGEVRNPDAFCGAMTDEVLGFTGWRSWD